MFSKRLKNLRINKKLSQQFMADYIGITRQGYGKYEDGQPEYKEVEEDEFEIVGYTVE